MTKTLPFLTRTYDRIYAIASTYGALKTLNFCSTLGISPPWEINPFDADFDEKEKTLFIISSNFFPNEQLPGKNVILDFLLLNDQLIRNGSFDLYFIEQNTFIDYTTSISKLNKFIVATAKRMYFDYYLINPWTGYGPAFLNGPPIGYKEIGTAGILDWGPVDEYKDPIKYLFEVYRGPKPEMNDLLTVMKMYGLDLTPNRISRILRNPFYAGYFKLDDKFYPHIHEAIIDKKLYNAVQKKLKRGNPII